MLYFANKKKQFGFIAYKKKIGIKFDKMAITQGVFL
jgi:hypothetical protein